MFTQKQNYGIVILFPRKQYAKGDFTINNEAQIIRSLTRIQERSNILEQHKEEIFAGIHLAEAHCIDKIGSMEYANVTKIAAEMEMTRGAISKITKKLLSKNLIVSYQKPENNKEIYFCLTEQGEKVYTEHKKCHMQARQEKLAILSSYSEVEQAIILRFLNDINQKYDKKLNEEV
ncbi:MAG: transcriptional regulator, MarR family [Firmicutes bacterium]|nr:transcriptional regulator, MarR family [Bacillota bacterium]